jgi:tetratricopeptide (TPR) repeat protein
MARVLNNLGIEAYFESRWVEASEFYLEALDVAQGTGDVVLAATAAINSAEILSDQGEWSQATALLAGAQRNYTAVGYTPGVAASMLFAGVASCRDGRYADAESSFTTARGLLRRLKMVDLLDELDARELELELLRGNGSVARCLELADRFGPDHQCTPRVRRLLGLAQHLAGETEEAVSTLLQVVGMTPAGSFEQSQTFLALAWVAPDAPDADSWRAEAQRVSDSLGIHRPPPLPPMTAAATVAVGW